MPIFDLELRLTTFGSVLTSKIYLEDSTNEGNRVLDWDQHPDGSRVKKLPQYQINDNNLDVYAGCQGIEGGYVSCEVWIAGKARDEKVKAKVIDKAYVKKSFTINAGGQA